VGSKLLGGQQKQIPSRDLINSTNILARKAALLTLAGISSSLIGATALPPAPAFAKQDVKVEEVREQPPKESAARASINWAFEASGVEFPPVFSSKLAFIATDDLKVIALDKLSGKEMWTAQLKAALPPICDGKRLYIGTENTLYALDIDGGKVIWSIPIESDFQSRLLLSSTTLNLLSKARSVTVINSTSGEITSTIELPKDWRVLGNSLICVSDSRPNKIYLGLVKGDWKKSGIFELDVQSQGLREAEVSKTFFESPGARPCFTGDHLFLLTYSTLKNVDMNSGTVRWSTALLRQILNYESLEVLVHGDKAYVVNRDSVFCIDMTTGDKRWVKALDAGLNSSLAIVGDAVFVASTGWVKTGTQDNLIKLYALNANTGDETGSFFMQKSFEKAHVNLCTSDGLLFISIAHGEFSSKGPSNLYVMSYP
jgi:outer membrane protein assembly factor BamB